MKISPVTYNVDAETVNKCLSSKSDCGGPLAPAGTQICLECAIYFENLILSKSPIAAALKTEMDNTTSDLDKLFGKLYER